MKIDGRFGVMDVRVEEVINFPDGLIGFPEQRSFVLLRRTSSSPIGWLQSTSSPDLAFPVVSVESLANEVSMEALVSAASSTRFPAEFNDCAVMVVICASGSGLEATVNLLAPIVVNAQTRQGAQVILEDSKFSTREPFCLVRPEVTQATHRLEQSQLGAPVCQVAVSAEP